MLLINLIFHRKDTEPLYPYFMYSHVTFLSGIYPLHAMHSLFVTIIFVNEAYIVIYTTSGRQVLIKGQVCNPFWLVPFKGNIVTTKAN